MTHHCDLYAVVEWSSPYMQISIHCRTSIHKAILTCLPYLLFAPVWFKVKRLYFSVLKLRFKVEWMKKHLWNTVVRNDLQKDFKSKEQVNSSTALWLESEKWLVFTFILYFLSFLGVAVAYLAMFCPVCNCVLMLFWSGLTCK